MQLNNSGRWQRYGRIGLALLLGLWAANMTLSSFVNGYYAETSLGAMTIRYVDAATGQDANNCTNLANPCATVQYAVDSASSGDEIRIAGGIYTDVIEANGLDQTGYIDISLTIRGGYSVTNFTESFPLTQTTILDAQTLGRGLVITGAVTAVIENLTIQNGDATGQGGAENGNSCPDAGGGIYVNNASVTLTNNKIQSNTACEGGGVFVINSPAAVLMNNEISQNDAYDYGGGFYLSGSNGASLKNNDIFQNVANQAAGGQKHCGGGRINNSSNVQVIGNAIYENIAANSGGGLCLKSADNALIQNNLIYDNMRMASFVGSGAGIFVNDSDFVQIVQNSIYRNGGVDIDNLGTLTGGGIYASFADNLSLDRNLIYDNIATLGGGIYLKDANSVESSSNIIRDNRALDMPYNDEGFGGGIFVVNSDFSAENSVIIDNEADIVAKGSGFYIETSDVLLQHPTIARNNPMTGTAVFISDTTSTLSITNAIIVSHAVGIDAPAGSTANLFDVLWFENSSNTVGGVSVAEEITAASQFEADGFHLTITSPALNQATPSDVSTDVDGGARPSCTPLPALGADERQCVYVPIVLKQ
jgi:parallel beta-helix repeat protein